MTLDERKGGQPAVRLPIGELPEAVALLSSDDFRLKYMNDTFRGYLPEAFKCKDLVDTRFVDLVMDGEDNPAVPILRRISESGKGEVITDFRVTNRDGEKFWVDWIGSPIDNGTDRFDVLVQLRDITERKDAESKLAYQVRLIECVSDAIISMDQQGRIEGWNKAAESIYGYKAEEAVGKPIVELLRTTFINDTLELSTRKIQENGRWQGEVHQKRKDGTPLTIFSSVSYCEQPT